MNKKLLTIVFVSIWLAACSSSNPVKEFPVGSITCKNKQDHKLDFTYMPENALAWHSVDYNMPVYLIDTIDSGQIAVNSLELENYTCTNNGL